MIKLQFGRPRPRDSKEPLRLDADEAQAKEKALGEAPKRCAKTIDVLSRELAAAKH